MATQANSSVHTSSRSETTATTGRKRRKNRDRIIQNVKTGGNLLMYVGSAGLMRPIITKAQENQNGAMNICSFGAGTVMALGLGHVCSKYFDKIVDKIVDFWDDVKSKDDGENENDKDEEDHKYTRY